jgi:hypothetical protein
LIAQEFDELANPRRQRSALAEIDGVHVLSIAGIELLEHGNKPSRLYVSGNMKQREPCKSGATEG